MIRLTVETPDGQGHDLTSEAEGLVFSNVRPGGDETATFALLRSWLDSNPEVKRGAIVRVEDGLDVLWQGRLEEVDRAGEDTEVMKVTSYGLGARLKDGRFRIIFINRNFEVWGEMSRSRRIALMNLNIEPHDGGVVPDATNGLPALRLGFDGAWVSPHKPQCEAWWNAGDGLAISRIFYSPQSGAHVSAADANWSVLIANSSDASGVNGEISGDIHAAGMVDGIFAPTTPQQYQIVLLFYEATPAGTAGVAFEVFFRHLVAIGTQGLPLAGDAIDNYGYTADQLVGWIVAQVAGISVRRLESQPFVIPHSVFREPTAHEDGIRSVNELAGANWGTWGPDSVLDRSDTGYFTYAQPDDDADWTASRIRAEDLSLSDELGSLYNRVDVTWRDEAGAEFVEARTAIIPALEEAGFDPNTNPRTKDLDLGTGTQGAAQQLADVFFALQGAEPPARGQITLRDRVYHRERGWLPPHYMRADGSNVKVPETLPYSDAVGLGDVDRRTIFPIQRVSVDASGKVPQTSVEVDQGQDLISVLQARIAAAVEAV